MLKNFVAIVVETLINKIPDRWKIIIGVAMIMGASLIVIRGMGIQESKAYSDSLHTLDALKFEAVVKYNDAQIKNMVKHSDKQFDLLRDDIHSLRQQNNDIIKLLINKHK